MDTFITDLMDKPALDAQPMKKQEKSASRSDLSDMMDKPALDAQPMKKQEKSASGSDLSDMMDKPALDAQPMKKQEQSASGSDLSDMMDKPALDAQATGPMLEQRDFREAQSLIDCPHPATLLSLDLSFLLNLTTLPDGIQHLTALQTLNLDGCVRLQRLPDAIQHLTSLQTLNLEGCESLQSLPDAIQHLTALHTLNLEGCTSLQSLPDAIQHLTALHTLNLECCESLQSLPDAIQHLTALQTLNLEGCESLQSLPDAIQHLTALQTLNLEGCESLQSRLDAIQRLTALQTLNLEWSKSLQSLPDAIQHLTASHTNLEERTSLGYLPDAIQQFTAWHALNLEGCVAWHALNLEGCVGCVEAPEAPPQVLIKTEQDHVKPSVLEDEGSSKVIIAGSSDMKTTVIRLSIIKDKYEEDRIVIGMTHTLLPCESLEFFFTKVDDMSSCVGVGLEHSKVQLGHDLQISIHQMDASEWESEAVRWRRIMADESSHHSMSICSMMGEEGDDSLKSRCGLEFDCAGWKARYVDETYNEGEVTWPILFDIAAFVLAHDDTGANQCNNSVNDQNFTSRVDASNDSSQQAGSNTNSSGIWNKICGYISGITNRSKGNGDGGGDEARNNRGDGDEEKGDSSTHSATGDVDCKKLTVKVNARVKLHEKMEELTNRDASLERAAIIPNLEFDFYKNGQNRKMVIRFASSFELRSCKSKDTLWYHDEHEISMSSEEGPISHEDPVRLEFGSHKIINEQVECKSTSESNTTNKTGGGQELAGSLMAGVPSHVSLQLSAKFPRLTETTTSNTHHKDQMPYQRICNGFRFEEHHTIEAPASFAICLSKPADISNVWDEETMEKCKGLTTAIEPKAQATWLPCGLTEKAPYFFKAKRRLILLHKGVTDQKQKGKQKSRWRGARQLEQEDKEDDESWPEEYRLDFKINEAMTHLQNKTIDVRVPKEKGVAGVMRISLGNDSLEAASASLSITS